MRGRPSHFALLVLVLGCGAAALGCTASDSGLPKPNVMDGSALGTFPPDAGKDGPPKDAVTPDAATKDAAPDAPIAVDGMLAPDAPAPKPDAPAIDVPM